MQTIARLLTLAAAPLSLFACGTEFSPPVERHAAPIVNGTADSGDPATVYLDLGGGACTGTLVSRRVVLTARHCLEGVDQGAITVFFGQNAGFQGTIIDTIGHEFHPDADVGMITLAEDGPADPIPMGDRSLAPFIGGTVRIAGFGVINEEGFGGGAKRHGLAKLNSLQGGLMFTSGEPDLSWTCYGDSGGPNFMTFEGVEYVVGVTSFGTQACGSGLDGSVRTDIYIDWLRAYVDANEDDVPPTVSITSPADGAQVMPGFAVTVEAADDKALASVQLQVDGTVVASDQFSPYDLVAPPGIALGMHELKVVARDRAGNETSAIIHVTIGAGCTTDNDCEGGAICAGGACVGDLGSPCDVHGDCASGECNIDPDGERACTEGCAAGDSCPSGFSCLSATQGAPAKCWPAEGDGGPCAAAPGRRSAQGLSLLVMLGVALLARRRRAAR